MFELVLLEDARNHEVRSGLDAASPWSTRDFFVFQVFVFFSSLTTHIAKLLH
jgi:hypothetical protein